LVRNLELAAEAARGSNQVGPLATEVSGLLMKAAAELATTPDEPRKIDRRS
jgi:hypothetical protein